MSELKNELKSRNKRLMDFKLKLKQTEAQRDRLTRKGDFLDKELKGNEGYQAAVKKFSTLVRSRSRPSSLEVDRKTWAAVKLQALYRGWAQRRIYKEISTCCALYP
jgi:hypothetical protein